MPDSISVDSSADGTPPTEAPAATVNQIFVASLLGGPLAGYYLAAHNYRIFGQGHRFASSLFTGVLGTVVVVAVGSIWPLSILHLAAVVMAAFLVRNSVETSQRRALNQHLSDRLPVRSFLNVLGVAVPCFVLSALLWFLAAVVAALIQGPTGPA